MSDASPATPTNSSRPHRFPKAALDVDWLIAWRCDACGETVSEFGPRTDCSVDWRNSSQGSAEASTEASTEPLVVPAALASFLNDPANVGNDFYDDAVCALAPLLRRDATRTLIGIETHRSDAGYGWTATLILRGKHRLRFNSPKATTPMRWRLIRGGDEDCNRAVSFTAWPFGMIDVWWEPRWRPAGTGPCAECEAEMDAPEDAQESAA